MSRHKEKSDIIQENIESTISNAIDAQEEIKSTSDLKLQQKLLEKNKGRAEAIPSLIRDMKEAEAAEELERGFPKG